MNYLGIEKTSMANGPGVRVVLWVSGCDCRCEGCHNPESWDYGSGNEFTDDVLEEIFDALRKPWVRGITLSGGHPLAPKNLSGVLKVIKEIKRKMPNKDVWLYTGYVLSMKRIQEDSLLGEIIRLTDVIVDGPYIKQLEDISLKFRGSTNQRIIDINKSIKQNEIVEWTED